MPRNRDSHQRKQAAAAAAAAVAAAAAAAAATTPVPAAPLIASAAAASVQPAGSTVDLAALIQRHRAAAERLLAARPQELLPAPMPRQPPLHWDFVLGEMQVVAKDVAELRKFKRACARSVRPLRLRAPSRVALAVEAFWDTIGMRPPPVDASTAQQSGGTLLSASAAEAVGLSPAFRAQLSSSQRDVLLAMAQAGKDGACALVTPDEAKLVVALLCSLGSERGLWGPHLVVCAADQVPLWQAAVALYAPAFRTRPDSAGARALDIVVSAKVEPEPAESGGWGCVVSQFPELTASARPQWPSVLVGGTNAVLPDKVARVAPVHGFRAQLGESLLACAETAVQTEARRAREDAAEQAEACQHPALAAQRRELMVLETPCERVPRCARAVRVPHSPVDSASGKFIAAVAHVEAGRRSLVVSASAAVLDAWRALCVSLGLACVALHRARSDVDEAVAVLACNDIAERAGSCTALLAQLPALGRLGLSVDSCLLLDAFTTAADVAQLGQARAPVWRLFTRDTVEEAALVRHPLFKAHEGPPCALQVVPPPPGWPEPDARRATAGAAVDVARPVAAAYASAFVRGAARTVEGYATPARATPRLSLFLPAADVASSAGGPLVDAAAPQSVARAVEQLRRPRGGARLAVGFAASKAQTADLPRSALAVPRGAFNADEDGALFALLLRHGAHNLELVAALFNEERFLRAEALPRAVADIAARAAALERAPPLSRGLPSTSDAAIAARGRFKVVLQCAAEVGDWPLPDAPAVAEAHERVTPEAFLKAVQLRKKPA